MRATKAQCDKAELSPKICFNCNPKKEDLKNSRENYFCWLCDRTYVRGKAVTEVVG